MTKPSRMRFCEDSGPFKLSNSCVRATWGAVLPAVVTFAFCVFALPIPHRIQKFLVPLKVLKFLTLHEAEALYIEPAERGRPVQEEEEAKRLLDGSNAVFASIGASEAIIWGAVGCYHLMEDLANVREYICPFLLALSWLYTVNRATSHPIITVPFDLFYFYLVAFATGILQVGGYTFSYIIGTTPLPSAITLTLLSANVVVIALLLALVLVTPLDIPGNQVDKNKIGISVNPEDYTTLFGWITFSWIYPLIRRGRYTTLNEQDIWINSPTMQSIPVFVKFSEIRRSTLLRRLWVMNSYDVVLDFCLTIVTVTLSYGGPFFLKLILDTVDIPNPTSETRGKAYIYAVLAFVCTLLKGQADVLHHWHCRRATAQMRCALMASIYDKALKRKDLSGLTNKDNEKKGKGLKKEDLVESKKAANSNDAKAGAGVGKIVSMMGSDLNRLARTITGAYTMYGAPFEIIIATTFLYQLLGISAFAGVTVLVVIWPWNAYLSKRSIGILKGSITAKDKRMGVLNELIGAIKFIKFFAWEERWIDRALEAREVELKWLIKSRINYIMFYSLWTCVPIFVSIVSFLGYVMLGNELTISVAFTSVALFNMLRGPLNVIPTWVVQFRQAGVALDRIAVYFDEDEVSEQVSSLKKVSTGFQSLEHGLGLVNATLKWNKIPKEAVAKSTGKESTYSSRFPYMPKFLLSRFSQSSASTVGLTATSISVSSEPRDDMFQLRNVNIRIPDSALTVVTGPTASGKTALLMALLGEMTLTEGRIILSKDLSRIDEHGFMHSISYAAQTPWLRNQSIKANILFGYSYDEERYKAVLDCCALNPDLEVLEDGDETEIGARGVSLSGGQKARVALARAVYVRTKYVLLDDPLSAVDSHTARLLYEKLLCGPLLENRTVILVTHHVHLVLPGTYYLVRMLDGSIDAQGPVKELRAQGILNVITRDAGIDAQKEDLFADSEAHSTETTKEQEKVVKVPRKLIKEEHRETGGVKWSVYNKYIAASSYWIWTFLALIVVANQLLGVIEKIWMMIWADAYGEDSEISSVSSLRALSRVHNEDLAEVSTAHQHYAFYMSISSETRGPFGLRWPKASQHPLFYIGVFASIGLAKALVSILSVIAQYTAALRASRKLFKQLLVTVIHATFRWHDTTPQGRMLNRFGKDIDTLDSSLAGSLQSVNSSLAGFFAAVLIIAIVFPYFLIPAFFLGLAYRELGIGYLNTSRDLRRLEANTKSPILSEFGELLEGIVTVRAFSSEKRFLDNLHSKIDTTMKMWYSFWMINRWIFLNFDALGAFAVLVTMLFSIATLTNEAGLAGLCITSAMSFTLSVYWACRFWTALELDLNSVERVIEYLDLPQEPAAIIESNRVPAYWPSSVNNAALVSVENLVVKYAPELPAVLQDVSFTAKSGERVGFLGRTGSGKSTLAMSILRFVDPVSGRIIIDGIDISTIGTYDLRSRLTFIPQDATLFSGSLRENLDPFDEYEDSQLLDVLYRVQMITRQPETSAEGTFGQHSASSSSTSGSLNEEAAEITTGTESKRTITLDTQVSAGGANFSQGQRQLIAMARALLRRSSIIVLDEATSSIDFETDAKIQATIREEFTDCLLLTVAHRLRTVIDYDRLIVLDNGQIAEIDTPCSLIQKEDGVFRKMCLKSGSFEELEAAAKAKAELD